MASPSGANGEMAIISSSGEDRIAWRPGFSESTKEILFIVQRLSFKGLGICKYLEAVTKSQPFGVFKGTGVS
jgi:hypothetical protein